MLFPFRWSPLTSYSSHYVFGETETSQVASIGATPLLVEKTSQVRQSLGLLPWCGRWTFHVSWISTNLRYQPSTPPTPHRWVTAGCLYRWRRDIFGIETWLVCCWFHPLMLGVLIFFGTILFEGASHFYSSWRELWGRRHLFGINLVKTAISCVSFALRRCRSIPSS